MSSPHTQPNHSARVIALLNQKGGVGKTTSTVNLGAALALAEQRVLLVDLDPQAHLTLHLGIEEETIEHSVYDLLTEPEVKAEQAIIKARTNLDVIFSEVDLAGLETELASMPDRQHRLRRKLQPIMSDYDVVLLDCPPSLGLLTLNALSISKEVFVPMQAHFLALQGVGKLLETVGLVCQSVNPSLRVTGILLCMHEAQTTLAKEIVADLEDFFTQARDQNVPWGDCRLLHPPIRRNIKLAEAPSFGQTIFDYSPWCKGAIDYRKLARGLIEQWHCTLPPPPEVSLPPEELRPATAQPTTNSTVSPVEIPITIVVEPKPHLPSETPVEKSVEPIESDFSTSAMTPPPVVPIAAESTMADE